MRLQICIGKAIPMNSTNGLANSATDHQERILWRWEMFFEEVRRFLQSAHDRYGTANEGFSQYVIERITYIAEVVALQA